MRRTVIATIVALTGFALVTGFAASMTVNGASLASGTAVIAPCDADEVIDLGFVLDPTVSATAVQGVQLSNVDAACDGADYAMDISGTLTSGTLTVVGGAATLDISSLNLTADVVDAVTLTITG